MVAPPLAGKRVWILPIVLLVAALMVLPSGAILAGHAGHAVPGGGSASSAAVVSGDGAGSALAARLSGISLPHPSNLAGSLASSLSSLTSTAPPARQLTSSFAAAGGAALPPTAGTTDLSARLAKVNSTFAGIPDSSAEAAVARLVAAGTIPARAVYLPNQKLLSEPATAPVTPTYNVSPAPMGIADFGLSSDGAYTVYTPDVLGSLTLNGYNASGGSLYQDTGAYYWDGLSPNAEVTPWQSGVQLNTVVTNVSYPGSNTGVFWTQNVVDFSGNTLQFVDNVWNFTSPNAGLNASTLYSYDGNWVVGEFYYAYGPTLPISFPMTIDLYNNASNVNGRTTVTFGYRVTEGSAVFTGIYDTVVFNSKPTTLEPLLTPHYLIDGNQPTYTVAGNEGPLYDAELVFGGPGDGSNSVITSLNGSMNLNYLLGSTWTPAHAAYDYGADTGETAIGFAGWWQGSTEYVNKARPSSTDCGTPPARSRPATPSSSSTTIRPTRSTSSGRPGAPTRTSATPRPSPTEPPRPGFPRPPSATTSRRTRTGSTRSASPSR